MTALPLNLGWVTDLGHVDLLSAARPGPGEKFLGKPMHLADHVIAHELAHVRLGGHGPAFRRNSTSSADVCGWATWRPALTTPERPARSGGQ